MKNKILISLKVISLLFITTHATAVLAKNDAELLLSAMEGNPESQAKVAPKFKKLDPSYMHYWYKQAARQGLAYAQFRLGYHYLQGIGTEINKPMAVEWWSQAAEQGHALSQYNIGLAYYEGIGTDVDTATAKYWFKKGAKQGNRQCIRSLKQVEKRESDLANAVKAEASKLENEPNIALYTAASRNSSEMVSLNKTQFAKTKVLLSKNGWHKVQRNEKLAVWTYKKFVTVNADSTVTFIGDNVRTRLTPNIRKGNIVSELDKGETMPLLKEDKLWVQIELDQFTGWTQKHPQKGSVAKVQNTAEKSPKSKIIKVKKRDYSYTFKNTQNNNEWLFDNKTGFTVIIGTNDTESSLKSMLKPLNTLSKADIKLLSSKRQGIEWKHVFYGNFATKKLASTFVKENDIKPLSITSFKQAQQQRCTSWKRTIPVPSELKKYCLPSS